LTDALAKIGITHESLLQPIKDALLATRSYVDPVSGLVDTSIPDHKIRLEASRDGVSILGGVPKVGEGTPTAHGLNLFVAIDNGQGQRVQVSAHGVPAHAAKPSNVSIQIKDSTPRNVQATRPAPIVIDLDAPDPALND
jgi:hypothetical protein